jgi:predicted GNAT superfamily acetyltransferase
MGRGYKAVAVEAPPTLDDRMRHAIMLSKYSTETLSLLAVALGHRPGLRTVPESLTYLAETREDDEQFVRWEAVVAIFNAGYILVDLRRWAAEPV